MVKDIVCTLTSSQSIISKRVVVKVLGINKRNISQAMLRCAQPEIMNDTF